MMYYYWCIFILWITILKYQDLWAESFKKGLWAELRAINGLTLVQHKGLKNRVSIKSAFRALIKDLKRKIIVKFYVKNLLFGILINQIYNFQDKIYTFDL